MQSAHSLNHCDQGVTGFFLSQWPSRDSERLGGERDSGTEDGSERTPQSMTTREITGAYLYNDCR